MGRENLALFTPDTFPELLRKFTGDDPNAKCTINAFGFEIDYHIGLEAIGVKPDSVAQEKDRNRDAISVALDWASLRPITFQAEVKGNTLETPENTPVTDFLKQVTSQLEEGTDTRMTLIPDTNFFERRYGSTLFLNETGKAYDLAIPRLVVLELEALSHRKGGKDDWKRRQAYAAIVELVRLKEKGAGLLPQVEATVLHNFSDIAGAGLSDAWIRREAYDFQESINGGVLGISAPKRVALFVTSDLTNSLAATTDGLFTIYLGTKTEFPKDTRCSYRSFAIFVYGLAVLSEKIEVEIHCAGKATRRCEVAGWWSGKTIIEWKSDTFEVRNPPSAPAAVVAQPSVAYNKGTEA